MSHKINTQRIPLPKGTLLFGSHPRLHPEPCLMILTRDFGTWRTDPEDPEGPRKLMLSAKDQYLRIRTLTDGQGILLDYRSTLPMSPDAIRDLLTHDDDTLSRIGITRETLTDTLTRIETPEGSSC